MCLHRSASLPADIGTCASAAGHPAAACERVSTPRHTTLRRIGVALVISLLAAACGGGGKKGGDTYAAATNAQEACCEQLAAGRDDCLREIVRVPDEAVARSDANQDTYACVQEHFACDPGTGRATQPSAQAQLDCIQDLP